jgi:hypothetical protein
MAWVFLDVGEVLVLAAENAHYRRRRPVVYQRAGESVMDEEALNRSLRKFLKNVGVTSQREIETAVRKAAAEGGLKGTTSMPCSATITISHLDLSVRVNGSIEVE